MPIIEHAPVKRPGVTTLMAVGEPLGDLSSGPSWKTGLVAAGAAAVLGSRRPLFWGLVAMGVQWFRR